MRIRTIKPEFWQSDDITRLDYFTRLVFIGLWSYVDDNGVGRDEDYLIASTLFPRDLYESPSECSLRIQGSLKQLSDAGLIVRYEENGRHYLQIVTWEKHQNINRPSPARFPQYDAKKHHSLNTHGGLSEDSLTRTGNREQGKGTGYYPPNPPQAGGVTAATPTAPEPEPVDTTPAFELIEEPTPPATHPTFDDFWNTYPLHVGKEQARKAWRKAIKRATPAQIIAGAARYRDDPNREPTYTKHPGPWLNAGRWEDDPLPPRTNPTHTRRAAAELADFQAAIAYDNTHQNSPPPAQTLPTTSQTPLEITP